MIEALIRCFNQVFFLPLSSDDMFPKFNSIETGDFKEEAFWIYLLYFILNNSTPNSLFIVSVGIFQSLYRNHPSTNPPQKPHVVRGIQFVSGSIPNGAGTYFAGAFLRYFPLQIMCPRPTKQPTQQPPPPAQSSPCRPHISSARPIIPPKKAIDNNQSRSRGPKNVANGSRHPETSCASQSHHHWSDCYY